MGTNQRYTNQRSSMTTGLLLLLFMGWTTALVPRSVISTTLRSTGADKASLPATALKGSAVIDAPTRNQARQPTTFYAPTNLSQEKAPDEWAVRLYDDEINTRDKVAEILYKFVGLPDSDAYRVMMEANQRGLSIVGLWSRERAEEYCEGLKKSGLTCDIFPGNEL